MTNWLSPLPVRDAYDTLMRKLMYPASETLRLILETAMTPDEAQLVLQLPATAGALAAKLGRAPGAMAEQLDRMYFAGLVVRKSQEDGSFTYSLPAPYCIESASDNMFYAIGTSFAPKSGKTTGKDERARLDQRSRQLCALWDKFYHEEWYRWQRPDEMVHRRISNLGGPEGRGRSYGIVPAIRALEKSEALGTEAIPEYDLREVARRGERGIYTRACPCRTRAAGCDIPVWICGAAWEGRPGRDIVADIKADPRGQFHKYSGEEWLEIMVRCEEDHMMVHTGSSWLVMCNCCRDCCSFLKPLILYTEPWEAVHPSPYRAVVNTELCRGCTRDCMPRCAFKVFETRTNSSTGKTTPYIDPDKCVGCGQCVIGCKVLGALKLVREEAAGARVPVRGSRAKVPNSIKGLRTGTQE